MTNDKIYHLVSWKNSLQTGFRKLFFDKGLGIQAINHDNYARLGKQLWCISKEDVPSWQNIPIKKYKMEKNGWKVNDALFYL